MLARHLLAALFASVALFSVCASQAASLYSNNVITGTNPVIYYDLEETSGTTATDLAPAGGANNGTYINATLGAAGPRPDGGFIAMSPTNIGPAVAQDGKVQVSQLESTIGVGTSAYSAAIWFNSSVDFDSQVLNYFMERGVDTTNSGRRDGVGVGGSFSGTDPNRLFLVNNGSLATGSTLLSPGTWHHVVMVRDDSLSGGELKVYLNGNTTPEIASSGDWGGGTGDIFRFGNRTDNNPSLGLTGVFDEVAIWDRALTPLEGVRSPQSQV